MSRLFRASRALALGAALLLSLSGCGGGDKATDPVDPPILRATGSISGRVADGQSGQPLAGVEVAVGTLRASTGADGKYTLSGVLPGTQVVARFSKSGYASNFATLEVNGLRNSLADRSLARVAVRAEISAATGGAVTLAGSQARVELPAAGLVSASGSAYNGTVAVEMTPIDPGTSPLNMPGNFRAQGEAVPIESMGALQVELRDSSGAMLNLAPGKTATIRIPVPAGATSAPLTMPLYYFKESSGLWVQEGSATLAGNAPNQYYEGTVSHFTVWNADRPMDTMYITGCVVNGTGQPREASVTTTGLDYYGSATIETLHDGTFRIAARRNSRVQLSVGAGDDVTSVSLTTSGSDMTLPSCLVLDKVLPVIVQQPVNLNIAPGFLATLDVVANNATQYTWYRNGVALAVGTRTLPLLGTLGTAGSYHVVASNAYGSVTSATVTVTVAVAASAPVISSQPRNVSVVAGSAPTFAVDAQGDSLLYQWLRNGVEIAGAQSPELILGPASAGDNGAMFSVRVTNGAGTVTSDAAMLTVNAEAVAPAITGQPANVSAAVGQNATFAVSASGTGPFRYQWLRNGVDIAGAVDSTYRTAALVMADHGAQFSVRVTNAKGSVTSTPAVLSVSAGTSVPGLHLSFHYGVPVNDQLAYGAVPAAGGTPVSLQPAGQGDIITPLVQAVIANGVASNYYTRSILMWKNGTIVRRDLSGASGLPPEARVSTITSANACDVSSSGEFTSDGNDAVDALRSWYVVRKQGADAACGTDDDQFFAVRANMSATDAPLPVARPVAAIHSPQGALTGWLVRNGLQMQRVGADFANPVTLFTLPSDDAEFTSSDAMGSSMLFYSVGGSVYVADLTAAAPATPTMVATLGTDQYLGEVDQITERDMVFSVGNEAQTRLLRFTKGAASAQAIATVTGRATIALVTATRVVVRNDQQAMLSYPLTGGAPVTLSATGSFMDSVFTHAGGERIWLQSDANVVSINSDGSGSQTLSGARLAGCTLKPQTPIWTSRAECDAVMVISGTALRSYDAQTGAARISYGNVTMPAAPLISYFYFDPLTAWGQSGILTQVVASPDFATTSIVNYLVKTDQAGVTQIVMP